MKTDKCWSDMVSSSGACDNTGQKILDSCSLVMFRCVIPLKMASVITASGDHRTCYRLGSILVNGFSDVPKSTDVMATRPGNIDDVIVE